MKGAIKTLLFLFVAMFSAVPMAGEKARYVIAASEDGAEVQVSFRLHEPAALY